MRDAVEKAFEERSRSPRGVRPPLPRRRAPPVRASPCTRGAEPQASGRSGAPVHPRTRLARFKERWEREVTRAVGRFERRALIRNGERLPILALTPARGVRPRSLAERLIELGLRRATTEALGPPSAGLLRAVDDARQVTRRPTEILQRFAPRLAMLAAPTPLRAAIQLARFWGRFGLGWGGDRDG